MFIKTSSVFNEVLDHARELKFLGNAVPVRAAGNLVRQEKEFVTEHERIPAKEILKGPDGETIIDFGQNMAGFVEITGSFSKGSRIRIRHGEALSDGRLYTKNLRTAKREKTGPRHPKTDKDLLASAYFYHSAELLVKCGHVLKKDVSAYEELLPKIRAAFRERYLSVTDTEAACAVLLSFGLLNEDEKAAVAAHLADLVKQYNNRLVCGVVGAPLILHALSENGYARTAFDMLLEEETPSWLGMVKNGATTLWERPDTYESGKIKDIRNASFNHYMFGSVLDFITGCAGDVKASEDGPGYKVFTWRPIPDRRIGSLHLEFESRAGKSAYFVL